MTVDQHSSLFPRLFLACVLAGSVCLPLAGCCLTPNYGSSQAGASKPSDTIGDFVGAERLDM
jgi:hypothetical protein